MTYLDCAATTPVDPRVGEIIARFMVEEFGNAGSRTHEYGARAKRAVQIAREQVAGVVGVPAEDVYFTSGATESNNIALLGLASWAEKTGKKHILSTQIEHKAFVLEPLQWLATKGFEVEFLAPNRGGWIEPSTVHSALRDDTALLSVMHVNNETGVIQPLDQISEVLRDHQAYFHVDAAQGFGKLDGLDNPRVDLLSVSGHKIFGPKGIGALLMKRRGFERPPVRPLMFGGGQEKGLRPGTLPVALIAGLGLATQLAHQEKVSRAESCRRFGAELRQGLEPLQPLINGDQNRLAWNVLNVSFCGIDSEAALVALKDVIALSNGSACTSQSYQPSHVLAAMGLERGRIASALRLSWSHMTPPVDWTQVVDRLAGLGAS